MLLYQLYWVTMLWSLPLAYTYKNRFCKNKWEQ